MRVQRFGQTHSHTEREGRGHLYCDKQPATGACEVYVHQTLSNKTNAILTLVVCFSKFFWSLPTGDGDCFCDHLEVKMCTAHCAVLKLYHALGLYYMCSVTVSIQRRDPEIIDSSPPPPPPPEWFSSPSSSAEGRKDPEDASKQANWGASGPAGCPLWSTHSPISYPSRSLISQLATRHTRWDSDISQYW